MLMKTCLRFARFFLLLAFLNYLNDAPFVAAAPPNDNCTLAQDIIPSVNGVLVKGTTDGGNPEQFIYYCIPSASSSPTVYYSFVGSGRKVSISTCSSETDFPTALALAYACRGSCDRDVTSKPDESCSNPNAAAITFDAKLRTNYILIVYGRQDLGKGKFGLFALEYDPPKNNDCENLIAISTSTSGAVEERGSTVNGTKGRNNYCQPSVSISPTVYYSFVGKGTRVKISTCDSETDFPTALAIAYACTGSCDRGITSKPDDSCSNPNAAVITFDAKLRTNYILIVYSRLADNVENFGKSEGKFGIVALEFIPPENNYCTQATFLLEPTSNASSILGSTVNATVGPGNVAPTVYYKIRGNGNTYQATTCSQNTVYNTSIAAARDCSLRNAIKGSEDSKCSNNRASSVTWETTAGYEYVIAVHGRVSMVEGAFELIVRDLNKTIISPTPAPLNTPPTPVKTPNVPTPVKNVPIPVKTPPTPVKTPNVPTPVKTPPTPVKTPNIPTPVKNVPIPVKTPNVPTPVKSPPTPVKTPNVPTPVKSPPTPVKVPIVPTPVKVPVAVMSGAPTVEPVPEIVDTPTVEPVSLSVPPVPTRPVAPVSNRPPQGGMRGKYYGKGGSMKSGKGSSSSKKMSSWTRPMGKGSGKYYRPSQPWYGGGKTVSSYFRYKEESNAAPSRTQEAQNIFAKLFHL